MTSAPVLVYVFFSQIGVSTLLCLQNNSFEAGYTTNFISIVITLILQFLEFKFLSIHPSPVLCLS